MRSRYSAYALRQLSYLLASWHPSTRPVLTESDLDPATKWLGLRILAHERQGQAASVVEFVARWRVGGGRAPRLHERSRFTRVEGRWYYVDGEIISAR